MKTKCPFVISEFTNPSGKIVFQLYARIDGQRFRKNFPTRTAAEAERYRVDLLAIRSYNELTLTTVKIELTEGLRIRISKSHGI